MSRYTKGDTDGPNQSRIFTAGIHFDHRQDSLPAWGNRIECHGYSEEDANALRDRALACLNKFEGMTTDQIERMPGTVQSLGETFMASDRDRALLLKALEAINDRIYAKGAPLGSEDYFFIRQTCCDAVKAVEGGAI
jgi:hypothetical protein